MMRETVLSRSVRLIFSSGVAIGMGLAAQSAMAQEAGNENIQRVEITGSSIKRIAKEGALPVQVISSADIAKSGAKNVEDLVQALPAMQGYMTSANSVNGGGGGVQNASIHSVGASYTLVLLNGRRMAPYTAGSAVNLASIPLAAVERVEVLTDGASALYGADAIAGVINFVLKKNAQDFTAEGTYTSPEKEGGRSGNIALSKGFGDLEKDGFNVLASYSHDDQKELNASQRDFAKTGLVRFTEGGKPYSMYQLAINTTPASVTLNFKDATKTPLTFSPNYMKDGKCAPNTAYIGSDSDKSCWFDYSGTVQLIPKSKRDSLFLSGRAKINDDTTVFAEAVASKFSQTGRFAPPAQAIALPLGDAKYAANVAPYLAQLGVNPADVKKATMNMRFVDAGGRAEEYVSEARHFAGGVEGRFKDFDYTASYVHSENTRTANYAGGFMSKDKFKTLAFDPFAPAGGAAAVLAPAVLHELDTETKTKLDILSVRASGELYQLPAGPLQIGAGADMTKQKYASLPSSITQGPNPQQPNWTDTVFGSAPGALPIEGSRKSWGTFAEFLIPVIKNLDVTASVRYDSYDAIHSDRIYDLDSKLIGSGEQGNDASKATYKLSFRYSPVNTVLLRGSYGTGFKVANLDDVIAPVADAGVTSAKYNCPVKAPDPRAADCSGNTQYALTSGGNNLKGEAGLKPEESKQYTLGIRLDPLTGLSLGFDLWNVKMTNQITALPEGLVFSNPAAFNSLFSTVYDAGIGANKLVTFLPSFNIGSARYKGIDWDHSFRTKTGYGNLSVNWTGTYMLKSEVDLPDADANGNKITTTESSLGRFDSFNNVTTRVISRIAVSLKTPGMFTHTLTMNYRSGYHDQVRTAADGSIKAVNPDGTLGAFVGMARDVKSYDTYDWQTRAEITKNYTVTAGIKNLLDKDPSFSNRTSGGGNQVGYDGRYNSPLGRTFYVTAAAKF
ncbi:TonB-dependent receptor domain-containing protein [Rugamonas aquatica]|uniref:TonB-dependent receptor plug domain-containing protein n=1 Tax=Rugamonas aquatica TaxID=2743357 RepID=A0A6A7MXX2_9BURK|nr:TonB-dependent receptor [Rugamonas aquatica]MQA37589.1 TonB-dependent receptor plug domain-containing protein [Rugamonas aquatica]